MKLPGVGSKLLLLSAIVAMVSYMVIAVLPRLIPEDTVDRVMFWGGGMLMLGIICLCLSGGAAYAFGMEKKRPGNTVAAAVLGVLGGVWCALIIVPFLYPFPREAVGGTLAFLIVIGGAILVLLGRPKVGGILMLLGTIVGWSTLSWPALYATPLLLPGIALALAPKKRPAAIHVAMTLGIIGGLFAALCPLMAYYTIPYRFLAGKEVLAFWIWGLLFPGMALLAVILVLAKPKVAGILMLISGIIGPVGFFALGAVDDHFQLIAGGLASYSLIIAGTIAYIRPDIETPIALAPEKKRPAAIYVAMTLGIIGGLCAVLCTLVQDPERIRPFLDLLRGREVLAFWIWVLLFPGMGLFAAILVLAKPKEAGILMLMSGIIGPAGFFALGFPEEFWHLAVCAIAGFPLVIAGTIACIKE